MNRTYQYIFFKPGIPCKYAARDQGWSLSISPNVREHVRHCSWHTTMDLHYRRLCICLEDYSHVALHHPSSTRIGLMNAHAFIAINTTSRFTGVLINFDRGGIYYRILAVDTMPAHNKLFERFEVKIKKKKIKIKHTRSDATCIEYAFCGSFHCKDMIWCECLQYANNTIKWNFNAANFDHLQKFLQHNFYHVHITI